MWVQPVVEDLLQEVVLEKMVGIYRPDIKLYNAIGRKGNSYIKVKIKAFNEASNALPHIIFTDLDKLECSPSLIEDWITFPQSDGLLFRIAEREIEAWILADRNNISRYMGIPINRIPFDTGTILDPKEFIINLARKSRKKNIIEIVPNGTAIVGPGYNTTLHKFVATIWDMEAAAQHNLSLKKAIHRLKNFLK
jgi:hypothetical protein